MLKLVLCPMLVNGIYTRLFKKVENVNCSFLVIWYGITKHGLKLEALNVIAKPLIGLLNFISNSCYLFDSPLNLLCVKIDLLLFLDVVAKVSELVNLLVEVKFLVSYDKIELNLKFGVFANLLFQLFN